MGRQMIAGEQFKCFIWGLWMNKTWKLTTLGGVFGRQQLHAPSSPITTKTTSIPLSLNIVPCFPIFAISKKRK